MQLAILFWVAYTEDFIWNSVARYESRFRNIRDFLWTVQIASCLLFTYFPASMHESRLVYAN